MSAPWTASFNPLPVSRCACAHSTGWRKICFSGERLITRTVWPIACNRGTNSRPNVPVPPVTSMRVIFFLRVLCVLCGSVLFFLLLLLQIHQLLRVDDRQHFCDLSAADLQRNNVMHLAVLPDDDRRKAIHLGNLAAHIGS